MNLLKSEVSKIKIEFNVRSKIFSMDKSSSFVEKMQEKLHSELSIIIYSDFF